MSALDESARKRLAVLQLAERLGNAAEACRRSGVDRTSFYQWKRRFAREGVAGLSNRAPAHKSHPHTTPAAVSRRIVGLALAHPAYGCDRISRELARRRIEVSAVTIQKILHKASLGTYEARAAALEALYATGSKKLSSVQSAFLENTNPSFRERGARGHRPGALLCQGSFFLGRFDGSGPVYVHAVVDSFSSYAFGELASTTRIDTAVTALRRRALPFFAEHRTPVVAVRAGGVGEMSASVLRDYLLSEQIQLQVDDTGALNGFLERFRRTAVSEFLRRPMVRRHSRAGLARLQREFDDWLESYNKIRPHSGYPNYDATPRQMVLKDNTIADGVNRRQQRAPRESPRPKRS